SSTSSVSGSRPTRPGRGWSVPSAGRWPHSSRLQSWPGSCWSEERPFPDAEEAPGAADAEDAPGRADAQDRAGTADAEDAARAEQASDREEAEPAPDTHAGVSHLVSWKSRLGFSGISSIRTPRASSIALASIAATGIVPASPAP